MAQHDDNEKLKHIIISLESKITALQWCVLSGLTASQMSQKPAFLLPLVPSFWFSHGLPPVQASLRIRMPECFQSFTPLLSCCLAFFPWGTNPGVALMTEMKSAEEQQHRVHPAMTSMDH
jgi:hypothetical protein